MTLLYFLFNVKPGADLISYLNHNKFILAHSTSDFNIFV